MPWEEIGTSPSDALQCSADWRAQCCELALSYIRFCVGYAPKGCQLRIKWYPIDSEQEEEWCEVGTDLNNRDKYLSIGVHWTSPYDNPPTTFIGVCQALLATFNEAVKWELIEPSAVSYITDCTDIK